MEESKFPENMTLALLMLSVVSVHAFMFWKMWIA